MRKRLVVSVRVGDLVLVSDANIELEQPRYDINDDDCVKQILFEKCLEDSHVGLVTKIEQLDVAETVKYTILIEDRLTYTYTSSPNAEDWWPLKLEKV